MAGASGEQAGPPPPALSQHKEGNSLQSCCNLVSTDENGRVALNKRAGVSLSEGAGRHVGWK